MSRALVLIDGNSFDCSCERVFDPKLKRVPVMVPSNDDGCAIARTAEAKALGICNRRFGRDTVVTASAGMPTIRTWSTEFEMRSPRYTTRLSDLAVIGAAIGSNQPVAGAT